MKRFLIFLAIGLAASDKLDRTYLPPPGAQFAGGSLGDIDVPLELPHPSHTGPGNGQGSQTTYGINGEPVNFGDKIPKVPTTTISYAFSQTTTYPPAESYETTAFPINPVTGLPVQLDQGSYPYGLTQGQQDIQNLPSYTQNQANNFGTNVQPGFAPQGPTSTPATSGSPNYGQPGNQPLNQYPGQNVVTPGGDVQIPGSVLPMTGQNQDLNQYPNEQNYGTGQQSLIPAGGLGNEAVNQYTGQNVISPGGTVQIPVGSQGFTQYPDGQAISRQQGVLPSTASPQEILTIRQPGGNQYGVNYDGSQGQTPQGTYSGPPINVENLGGLQPNQASYQNQEPLNVGGIPSQQYPTGNQNLPASGPGGENVYQPGSTPTAPSLYYNGVSSTTRFPDFPSSTSAYSSVGPIYRPERPQAAADRNAVILNYENVRTPNGYSYSFDTSNGIHADENGIVDNGTKAQGSYSYTGDDGKVYSVIYTADENGFQTRGDHLPTPPPIPEAIKRVIEQAARDKEAGIFDDGSYDEAKYGDKKYQGTANRRRPQNGQIKPIVGLNYADETTSRDELNNNLPNTGTRRRPSENLPTKQPSNQIGNEGYYRDIPGENRRVSETGNDNTPFSDKGEDGTPLTGVNDRYNNFGTKEQGSVKGFPTSDADNVPFTGTEDISQQNQFKPNRRPTSSGVKGMQTKYPGSKDEFDDSADQEIDIGNPSLSNGPSKDMATKFDSVTGAPLVGKRKQTSNLRPKGNRRPGNSGNRHNQIQKSRPQGQFFTQESTNAPSISNYIQNAANQPNSNQYGTQQDENGYHYQSPKTEFSQTKFPTRFSPQELSPTMKSDQRRTGFEQGTTRRPFITPNVYNQNDGTRQSTTRRPFTTVGVTSPTQSSYTDYDDGDDYETDQDIDDENTIDPAEKAGNMSRPNQSTQTTAIPQYTLGGQRTSLPQKGTATPGRRTESSGTPAYAFGSTTPMPFHSSRFGNTEASASEKPQQRGPSPTVSGSTAVGRPVITETPSELRPSGNGYQTTGPVSGYTGSNVVPGYSSNGAVPGFGSVSSTPGSSNYRPSQGYSSTTTVPPASGNDLGFDSLVPSMTPLASQPSPTESFNTGYHYGPPKSGYSAFTSPNSETPGSGLYSPSGTPGVSQSTPGTYQTTSQPGYSGFSGTSPAPGRPGTFILSQPGTSAPEFQANYPNGPSTPNYSTTIVSSTPGASPVFGYPGSIGASNPQTPGYEYGTSKPSYSTTPSFVPSGMPSKDYSTTYRPGFQTTQETNVGGPLVDGFGRPITSEQGGSYPGFSQPGQASKVPFNQGSGFTGPSTVSNVLLSGNRPVDNSSPGFVSTESTPYPGSYDQTKVVGEDFSGPKQPQRFDPETGYHYK